MRRVDSGRVRLDRARDRVVSLAAAPRPAGDNSHGRRGARSIGIAMRTICSMMPFRRFTARHVGVGGKLTQSECAGDARLERFIYVDGT